MLMDIKRPKRFLYVQVIHVRMYICMERVSELEMSTLDKMESMILLLMCSSQVQIKPE